MKSRVPHDSPLARHGKSTYMSNKKEPRITPGLKDKEDRLHYFESRQGSLLQMIREFVEIESPSDDKLAGDRMGTLLAARFQSLGRRPGIHRAPHYVALL